MPATVYEHDSFALATVNGRDLAHVHVCIELDIFRDGAWTIVDVGVVDYRRNALGALCYVQEWDIPSDLAHRIQSQALTRYRASIDEHVFAVCDEQFGSARRIA